MEQFRALTGIDNGNGDSAGSAEKGRSLVQLERQGSSDDGSVVDQGATAAQDWSRIGAQLLGHRRNSGSWRPAAQVKATAVDSGTASERARFLAGGGLGRFLLVSSLPVFCS